MLDDPYEQIIYTYGGSCNMTKRILLPVIVLLALSVPLAQRLRREREAERAKAFLACR
jgi:hypothetical protein